jgi:hypothetical protein
MTAAVICGLALGLSLPSFGARDNAHQILSENVHLPDPSLSMQHAEAATPYEVKTPKDTPAGAEILLVETLEDPDTGYVNVDIFWGTDDGRRFHLWQTDASPDSLAMSGYDLSTKGTPTDIQGRTWRMVLFGRGDDEGISLAYQFEDGITVSLDAMLSDFEVEDVKTIAASIS